MEILAIVPILAFLLIAHEWGHFITARRTGIVVEEFAVGFPPRILSTVRDGVRYSLNLVPLGAYVKMLGEEDPSHPGSFAGKPKRVRALVLAAGSGMNFLVAILAFSLAYATGWPDPRHMEIAVLSVAPGSPAEAAGLGNGDVVHEVAGVEIRAYEELQSQTQQHLGRSMEVTVRRGGELTAVTLVPRATAPEGQGPIGISIRGRPLPRGPAESLVLGARRAFDVVGITFVAPVMALRGDLPGELVRPIGLPGMAQVAAQAATVVFETGRWFPVLFITGVFSAGLAVANMLPLPALDGGRLLFVVIEAVRGRRIAPEREGLIHLVGMVVLLSLMVFISFYDLVAPPTAIDWGVR